MNEYFPLIKIYTPFFLFFQHGPSLGTFWMFYDTGLQLSFHQKFFPNVRVLRKCLMTVEPVIILIIVMIVTNGLWLWILGHIVIARSVDWIEIWFYGVRSKRKFKVVVFYLKLKRKEEELLKISKSRLSTDQATFDLR